MGGRGLPRPFVPREPLLIVLRITIDGRTQQIRSPKKELLLGSDPTADVTVQDAGWEARAARLHHRGTEVFLEGLDGSPSRALRLGDEVSVGRARISLAGLLPLAEAAPSVPVFGGYDLDGEDAPRTFSLADDAGPKSYGTETTSHTFRPQDHRPSLGGARRADESTRGPQKTMASAGAKASAASQESQPETATQTAAHTKPETKKSTAVTEPAAAKKEALATQAELDAAAEAERIARMLRGSDDFATELYATLRKSPFYAVSIALHFLVFLLIALIETDEDMSKVNAPPGLVVGDFIHEEDTVFETAPDSPDDVPEVDTEFEAPELPAETADLAEPEPDNKPNDPSNDPDLADLPEPELKPLDIGVAPRFTSFKNRTRTRKPDVTKQDLEKRVLKGGADEMNDRSAGIVRGAIGLGPGGGTRGLLPRKSELLVVEGAFDQMDKVLDSLKIPYVKATMKEIVRGKKYSLGSFKVIFWNCGEGMADASMRRFRSKLKRWIAGGGYLFSTDWGIEHVVQPMFSDRIRTSGQRAPLREMVLHIKPTRSGSRSHLLTGVFPRGAKGQWWLEQASFDIEVQDPSTVTVLIEAPQLKSVFRRSPAVAVTFEHGRGRVLHVMGHYFQKMGNLAGTIASHRLALNFVIDRIKQDKKR